LRPSQAAAALGPEAQQIVPLTLSDLKCWDWAKARAGIEFIVSSFFPSVQQLHELIDLVPELRDHRRNLSLSLHVANAEIDRVAGVYGPMKITHPNPLQSNIFKCGFGLSGDTVTPSRATAILSFLNLHPDLVRKYVESIFAPSDLGDKDGLAALHAIFSAGPPKPPTGYRFCVGSHTAAFKIQNDTPPAISKLTTELHSNAMFASSAHFGDGLLVAVVKHWNFPAAIVSALEARFDKVDLVGARGLQLEFSGDAPGLLTCTVHVTSSKSLIGLVLSAVATKKIDAVNEVFCHFNRDVVDFSAECETLVEMWNKSSANDKCGQNLTLRLPAFETSLRALEKHTAAGPMLDAREAASLCTVPLKPYQSQTVRFMADAEQNKRGLQSAYWIELSPGDDASKSLTALFSPVTGEIIVNEAAASCMSQRSQMLPPASRGGFLFEAMGLGKTVEVIALLAKNPPPPALPLRLTVAELSGLPAAAARGAVHISHTCTSSTRMYRGNQVTAYLTRVGGLGLKVQG